MSAHLAQVCLFNQDSSTLRRFCEVVSGAVEHDDGNLTSYHMGSSTVAHHRPAGPLGENDVMVTLQLGAPADVDRIHLQLKQVGLTVDDSPETTEWGWRVFYFKVAPQLYFEVGAPV